MSCYKVNTEFLIIHMYNYYELPMITACYRRVVQSAQRKAKATFSRSRS